jgi:hypothetical protein
LPCNQGEQAKDEKEETPMVLGSNLNLFKRKNGYTVIDPGAMVVVDTHASLTEITVFRAAWLETLAFLANLLLPMLLDHLDQ